MFLQMNMMMCPNEIPSIEQNNGIFESVSAMIVINMACEAASYNLYECFFIKNHKNAMEPAPLHHGLWMKQRPKQLPDLPKKTEICTPPVQHADLGWFE